MESIAGRVALVTGGGRGIGRAIALALARAGADVALCARTVPELEAVAAEIAALGRRTHFFPLDVSDREALGRAPRTVFDRLGSLDILVNNAGVSASAPVPRTDDETWDAVLAVDLTAPFLLTRACLPAMYERRWGRIINIASVAARIGLRYSVAYSAAKHGLLGLTRSVALEAARKGVTVNAICPSWTETQMLDDAVDAIAAHTGRTATEARAAILASSPVGRAALPEEVADAALWLVASPIVTGQAIDVDGGEVMA
jgi:meso-butanediol dehydrogenase/(S,S)-butanediol dehydrogenase/diacetyl reductase